MLKAHAKLMVILLKTADVAALVTAWLFAHAVHVAAWRLEYLGQPGESLRQYLAWIAISVLLALIVFSHLGAYEPSRLRGLFREAGSIAYSVALCWGLIYIIADYAGPHGPSRTTMALFLINWMAMALIERLTAMSWLRSIRRRGFNLRHVAIAGTGRLAQKLYHALNRNAWMGIHVSYFIDETGQIDHSSVLLGQPVLGPIEAITELVIRNPVDIVFIAVRRSHIDRLEQVFADLTLTTVSVYLVPDLMPFQVMRNEVTEMEDLTMISLTSTPLRGVNQMLKRLTDVVLVCVAMAFFAIPMVLISLLVKLTSRGPVFYVQTRASLNGKTFRMMKFRTMKPGAESTTGPVWAIKDDKRVTTVGRFLRRTSLDELPQLLNVLKGDMSMVGPRPERPEMIEQFRRVIPHYILRHHVKAGITGLAQIRGWRGNTSLRKRIQHDLYYLRNWSLGLDLYILLLTALRGFVHSEE